MSSETRISDKLLAWYVTEADKPGSLNIYPNQMRMLLQDLVDARARVTELEAERARAAVWQERLADELSDVQYDLGQRITAGDALAVRVAKLEGWAADAIDLIGWVAGVPVGSTVCETDIRYARRILEAFPRGEDTPAVSP